MKNYLLGLIVFTLSSTAFAKFSYEGYLMNSDNVTPVTDSNVRIRLKIYDKLGSCLLYVEDHLIDMTTSGGYFSVVAGDGTSVTDYTGIGFGKIFSNAQNMTGSGSCPVTPAAGDQRKLDISVSIAAAAFEAFGAIDVFPTPTALVADNVGKFSPSHLLRLENAGVPATAAPLTSTNFTELQNLLNGTSTQYMKASGGMTSVPTGTGSGATAGSLWYDAGVLKYHNGVSVQTLGTAGSGITSLTGDVTGTGPGASATTISNGAVTFTKFQNISDNKLLGRSAGSAGTMQEITIGGGLTMTAGILSASGGPADASYAAKGIVQFDTSAATSGISVTSGIAKLANSGATSGTYGSATSIPVVTIDAFGRVTSISSNLIDMSAVTVGILPPGRGGTGSSSLSANRMVMMNGIGTALVSDSCIMGQYLEFNGTNWVCMVAAGGDFKSDGLISMTGQLKAYSGTPTAPGFSFDSGGNNDGFYYHSGTQAIGITMNGMERVRFDSTGKVGIGTESPQASLHILKDSANSLIINEAYAPSFYPVFLGRQAQGNQFSPTATQVNDKLAIFGGGGYFTSHAMAPSAYMVVRATENFSSATNKGSDLAFFTTTSASATPAQRMVISNNGSVGIGTTVPMGMLDVKGGPFVMSGTTSGYAGFTAATVAGSTIWTLPTADGSNGQVLSTNGAGMLGWQTLPAPGVVNNGNSFGSNMIIGSNDSYPLQLRTNGTNVVTVTTLGNVGIGIASPGYQLHLSTDSAAKPGTSTWTVASDERLKVIRAPFNRGLEDLNGLHTVYFNYKKNNRLGLPSDKEYVGIRAQDALKAIPESVSQDKNGFYHVTNDAIIWTAVNAIKELYNKYLAQDAEIAQLKQENKAIKAYLCARDASAEICGN